ncbi:MAG: UbiA family prenyltransferase [Deltaproteobacteria bacterium]|nr:UbiA family prenyltransferase [Deltaproteobacteria bacterium]
MSLEESSKQLERTGLMTRWGSLVKFSHTIFALPFALSMAVIVGAKTGFEWLTLLWIVVCIISARTAAMTFNRIIDREIDAKNPRTSSREIPSGKISVQNAKSFLLASSLIFVISAGLIGAHCLIYSPLVLFILFFYSWTKRFTSFSHLVLGLALALAPGGVWYAMTAEFALLPVWMMLGVLFWVAGFDILYSVQDIDIDSKLGLFSIPAKHGILGAFLISRIFHFLAVFWLLIFGIEAELGFVYYLGLVVFAGLLVSQHLLLKVDDLTKIDTAFFARNGTASILFLVFVCMDRLV